MMIMGSTWTRPPGGGGLGKGDIPGPAPWQVEPGGVGWGSAGDGGFKLHKALE